MKKRKYPKAPVVTTRNSQVRDAFYRLTDHDSPLGVGQIATGRVQHPDTGFWQVWVSTNGHDITSLAAFREESMAAGAVEIIKKEGREGNLANQAIVDALFTHLREQSDGGEPKSLPDEVVRRLVRDIAHVMQKENTL